MRYLVSWDVCYALQCKDKNADICGRVVSSVADEFQKEAKWLCEALILYLPNVAAPPNWTEFLAPTLVHEWLATLVEKIGNLEDYLCVGAICSSSIWRPPVVNNPQFEKLKRAIMATKWLNKALTWLIENSQFRNSDAKEIVWWVLSRAFTEGTFPGLSEDMAQSLIKKLKEFSGSYNSNTARGQNPIDPISMDEMFPARDNIEKENEVDEH
jgi:hypothetical protein